MSLRKVGIHAITQPRPPSASKPSISPSLRRVRCPSPSPTTRRPLPPGPGPLDKKGEKLVLKPINGSESFKPRKFSERSSNAKPLRAIHSLDRQYIRPDSDTRAFGQASQGSLLNSRRTKSFDDINRADKPRLPENPRKLQPLNYRASNFGSLPDALARGGSSQSIKSNSTVESPYLSSVSSLSPSPRHSPHTPPSPKPRRESYGGFIHKKAPVCINQRSSSLGENAAYGTITKRGTLHRGISTGRDLVSVIKAPGARGLQNLGNTCYQNTVYQCLSHTVRLRDFCLKGNFSSIINQKSPSNGEMIKGFTKLVKMLWKPDSMLTVYKPTPMRNTVSKYLTYFANFQQQDAQEFLRAFLDSMHDDLNRIHPKPRYNTEISDALSDENKLAETWRRHTSREKSLLSELFVGVQKSTLCCMECGNERSQFDTFWDLSLPIPVNKVYSKRDVSLDDCLDMYCAKEILEGDNRVTCNHCKRRTRQEKWLRIERFPQYLVLHLKRFVESTNSFCPKINKNTNLVDFPLKNLRMSDTMTDKETSPSYNCYAVANHSGTTEGGHYYAYCHHSHEDDWLVHNDSHVDMLISRSSVVTAHAYILFYERSDLTSHL